jgi:uncharacterized protein (TIGR00106 family)
MKDWVVAEVSVVPIGTATTSLSRYVAACVAVLEEAADVGYELTGMGTIIEGPLSRVLEMVGRMHEVPFEHGVSRVLTSLKIDDRRDKTVTSRSKVTAVEQAVGEPVSVPPESIMAGLP